MKTAPPKVFYKNHHMKKEKKKQHQWDICLRHFYWMSKRLGGKTWEAGDTDLSEAGQGKTAKEALLNYLKIKKI